MPDPDKDLDAMDHATLLAAARAMRQAIRTHRDSSGHELCWHHPDMWALLPDAPIGGQVVPDGLNSCAAASAIASLWISNWQRRRAATGSSANEDNCQGAESNPLTAN
jgi:hypothetical protein